MSDILHAKIKQKELVEKSSMSNLVKISDLIIKLKTFAIKQQLKAAQDETVKLQTHDLIYFLDKVFFDDDGFHNMLAYQPAVNML